MTVAVLVMSATALVSPLAAEEAEAKVAAQEAEAKLTSEKALAKLATYETAADHGDCHVEFDFTIGSICFDPLIDRAVDLIVGPTVTAIANTLGSAIQAIVEPLIDSTVRPALIAAAEGLVAGTDAACDTALTLYNDFAALTAGVEPFDATKPETLFLYKAITEVPPANVAEIVPDEAVTFKRVVQGLAATAEVCALIREGEVEAADDAEHGQRFQELLNKIAQESQATQTHITTTADGVEQHVTNESQATQTHVTNEIAAEHDFRVVMDIHDALTHRFAHRNALLVLPGAGPDARPNGLLELVRQVVADTIVDLRRAGVRLRLKATRRHLALGDEYYDAGEYILAYDSYKAAYMAALEPIAPVQP